MKKCSRCSKDKELTCYYKVARNKDGLHTWCKECVLSNNKNWRLKNIDLARQINKTWKDQNPEKIYQYTKKYKQVYPEKSKANGKINDAIRRGKLIKPSKCQSCKDISRLDGHHPDYSKPLEIIWLCRKCHTKVHSDNLA